MARQGISVILSDFNTAVAEIRGVRFPPALLESPSAISVRLQCDFDHSLK
jgi:hypothetical protein